MPCRQPPHRDAPDRDAAVRLEMLLAAIDGEPRFRADDRELRRPGPSFTFDTLVSLREELGDRPLCLLLGMDAFLGLSGWHRWRELIDYAHLVVAHRPGWVAPREGQLGEMLDEHAVDAADALHRAPNGGVLVTPVTQLEISSTALRSLIGRGGDPRYLVPDAVREIALSPGVYR